MKGIIFDLDGTLIDSMGVWEKADCDLLKKYGFEPDKEYRNIIVTLNFTEGANYVINKFKIDSTVEKIKEELYELVSEQYSNEINLKEGVLEFLELLKKNEIKASIATSSVRHMCEAVLKRNGVESFFEHTLFSDEIGSQKSEPDIFIETARRMNLDPRDVIVFEDSPHAARGAKMAGMTVIGVHDNYCYAADELDEICDGYITGFDELLTKKGRESFLGLFDKI